MRDYQPIWFKLKTEGSVSITANRRFHPRIIKAVIKEKWMDFGFKLELAEEKKISLLYQECIGSVIKFTLIVKDRGIIAGDLGFHLDEVKSCQDTLTKQQSKSLGTLQERLKKLS